MNSTRAMALVAVLQSAFPEGVVSAETLQIYARFMADIDEDTVAQACATWCARERRFPFIADLRGVIDEIRGTAPPDEDLAWAEVIAAVKRGRRPARWSHPAIDAAVAAVGFREIGQSTTLGVERAHFGKAYVVAKRRLSDVAGRDLVRGLLPELRDIMDYAISASEQPKALEPGSQPAVIGGGRKKRR